MKNLDSTLIDLSIFDQDYQCKELLSATVLTMSGSRGGERMLLLSNGTLMKFQRQLRTTTGNLTHLIFKVMEDHQTSDVLLPTQDGGKCGELTELSLETLKIKKSWMYQVELMERTETLLFIQLMEESINNGTLYTLMNGRVNLKKVSSILDLVYMLKETSTLFLNYLKIDI